MKTRALMLLAGTGPLLAGGAVEAAFTGVQVTAKPNGHGLFVCNVYATFDQPGRDFMQGVAGTPASPLLIEVVDGTFYQHPLGSDRPPLAGLVEAFPTLAFDSFVTIGVKKLDPQGRFGGQPEDHMMMTASFPGFRDSVMLLSRDAWAVTPLDRQGDPFDRDFVAGDGNVLIGQFSTADGTAIRGTMLLQFISGGVIGQQVVSFEHVLPAPPAAVPLAPAILLARRRRRR